ncbi:MAG: DUF7246 family protein [Candidatus Saccharimonadales bacterium]
MGRRHKYKRPQWPEWWTVEFTWEWKGRTLESRKHMFRIKGERAWYIFDRHVVNTRIDKEWIDCFSTKPNGSFHAVRSEVIREVKVLDPRLIAKNATPLRRTRKAKADAK